MTEDSDLLFDRVLHSVGEDGKFQKRYNLLYNFLLSMVGTMIYMNVVISMVVPEHWCNVPGRNESEYSLEQWKQLKIPRERNKYGVEVYSSCTMYTDSNETTECTDGYSYNHTWFENTIASTENWVCDKKIYVANVLAIMKVCEVVGGTILSNVGDILGRRITHVIGIVMMAAGRLMMPFVTDWFSLFLISVIVASLPSMVPIQACLVLIMEMSSPEGRAFVSLLQHFGWTIGLSILPLIYWIIGDWKFYILATSAPIVFYIFSAIFLIESPRWLLSRGRVTESLKQLQVITKINGTRLSPDSALMLQNSSINAETAYGITGLCTNWRIFKNTLLYIVLWLHSVITYNLLTYNFFNLGGNPYLNFFLQSIVEIPGYILACYMCNWIGRRFCAMSGIFLIAINSIILILTYNDENAWLQITLVVFMKFSISVSYFVIILQGLEMFPTCIRQTANSMGIMVGNLGSVLAPYIVFLGTDYCETFPFIVIVFLSICALSAQIFLPETLHERLPETLHEAKTFGEYQGYWHFPYKKVDMYVMTHLKLLRQQSEREDGHASD